jgi:hypothetical protein
MADETYRPDDGIQHGIDDNPENDAQKGAAIGGVGGAAVGAAAGAMTGPLGAVIGAVVGGAVGAVASGAAVAAVDARDNDDNISGVGDKIDYKHHDVDDDDDVVDTYDRDMVGSTATRDMDVAGMGATGTPATHQAPYGSQTPEGFILDPNTTTNRTIDPVTGEDIGRETDTRIP